MSDIDGVLEVLERVRDGWERMDGSAVLACFERSERTVVIGTDEPEYWVGYDVFEPPFLAMAGAFSDAKYVWTDGPTVDVDGDVAWSTGKLLAVFMSGDERVELDMRTTHVLRRRDGDWRIVQGHYSAAAVEATTY